MIRKLKPFTEETWFRKKDGEWVVEKRSPSVAEQCNAWVEATGNVIVDTDVTFNVKQDVTGEVSVRYVHLLVTYMSLEDYIKFEALLRKMALTAQGFEQAMSDEHFAEIIGQAIDYVKNALGKPEEPAAEQPEEPQKEEPEPQPEPESNGVLQKIKEKIADGDQSAE